MNLKSLVKKYNNKILLIKKIKSEYIKDLLVGSIGHYYYIIKDLIKKLVIIDNADNEDDDNNDNEDINKYLDKDIFVENMYSNIDVIYNNYILINKIFSIMKSDDIQNNIKLKKSLSTFNEIYDSLNINSLENPHQIYEYFSKDNIKTNEDFFTITKDNGRSILSIKIYCKKNKLSSEEIYKVYKMIDTTNFNINPLSNYYHPIQQIPTTPWIKLESVDNFDINNVNNDNVNILNINPTFNDISYEDIKINYKDNIDIINEDNLLNTPIKKSKTSLKNLISNDVINYNYDKDKINYFTIDNKNLYKFSVETPDYTKYILLNNIKKNNKISKLVRKSKSKIVKQIEIPNKLVEKVISNNTDINNMPKSIMLIYDFLKNDNEMSKLSFPYLLTLAQNFVNEPTNKIIYEIQQ